MNHDHLPDEIGNGENFAEMFDKSYKEPSRLEPGQRIEAVIVKITADWAFLEVGGKGEGYLDSKELLDEGGKPTAKEGDKVRAYFLYSENGEMHFTTKIGSGPAAYVQLADAWRSGLPVEGTVAKELKGGFEVTISGGARAFCPFSQMGVRREENKENYLGRSLVFDIIECGERNIVLSRKGILERERQAAADALKSSLKEGTRLKGTVTSIRKFGAFVDIGGVEGLLPVSEAAWSRTENIGDILSSGQKVEVIVKKLDWENGRISLSLKDTLPDPWDRAAETWPPGSYHTGTVSRLAPFGAFITLGEGVDGLIHISRLGGEKRIQRPEEAVKAGQTIEVKVEAVDLKNKKISLVPADISREEEADAAALKSYLRQDAKESPSLGTLGEMLKKQLEKQEEGLKK
jgi:small subunit ribosomal protein S1